MTEKKTDVDKFPQLLFGLTSEQVDKAFGDYMKARFPFGYKMKFIAERFGALPRGKTMGPERLAELPSRFEKTPIYEETIREVMQEKVDLPTVKKIMQNVKEGNTKVSVLLRLEKPTPLGYRILSKYTEIPELMAPQRILLSNIERMKKSVQAMRPMLLCFSCGHYTEQKRIRELPDRLVCERCGSSLLADLRFGRDPKTIREIVKRRQEGKQLSPEELEELTHTRRTADLVLSYGKKALVAFQVKGVGPETAFRILGKMHPSEDDFYMDLLKAKIQFLRTRPYWGDQEKARFGKS